jgi:YD repeat-containing protein
MKPVTVGAQVLGLLLLFWTGSVSAATVSYQYDALHRLTQVTYANGTVIQYTYDPAGNRLTKIVDTNDADGDGLVDSLDPDDDNDGLPDVYEQARGTEPLVADADVDHDGDGVPTGAEYSAGTDPRDPASEPERVGGVVAVLLRDHFDDYAWEDRWSLSSGTPAGEYTVFESGTELEQGLRRPVSGCSGARLDSFAAVGPASLVLRARIRITGSGTTALGLAQADDPGRYVEVQLDNDQRPYLKVVVGDAGGSYSYWGYPSAPYVGETVEVRLLKGSGAIRVQVNGVTQVSFDTEGLGAVSLRPYLASTACAGAGIGDVQSFTDVVEVLLDRDGDGYEDIADPAPLDPHIFPGAGSLSGLLTDEGGNPLEGIRVETSRSDWMWWGEAYTGADGRYVVGGVPAGSYRVCFSDPSGQYGRECFDDAQSMAGASPVGVTAGAATQDIDARLALAGSIAGVVRGPGASPLSGIWVQAYLGNGSWWEPVAYASTAEDGTYALSGLGAGSYRVCFYDWDGQYVSECYDDVPEVEAATDVAVTSGVTTLGINAQLSEAGRITGRVTDGAGNALAQISVEAYSWAAYGWSWGGSGTSAPDGTYTIGSLAAGNYRVCFSDFTAGQYARECYDDAPDLETAADVGVANDVTTSGIDAVLGPAGHITGVITDAAGNPVSGVSAEAYRWAGTTWFWVGSGDTGADGLYDIGGLATGVYRVCFYDWDDQYVSECYAASQGLEGGTDVAVTAGATTAGIDAALALPGAISGTVTDTSGSPLLDIGAIAYRRMADNWQWVQWAYTGDDGLYTIYGLPAGDYRVCFYDWSQGASPRECYDDVLTLDAATDVTVSAGVVTPGVDAQLGLVGVDSDGDGATDDADLDDDGDGLPDVYEAEHGTNPLGADADVDHDGDGVSTGREHASGTDPRDDSSKPEAGGGVLYTLLRDHFDDFTWEDRWYPSATVTAGEYGLLESGTELEHTLRRPAGGCDGSWLESYAVVDEPNLVLVASLRMAGYGATSVGFSDVANPGHYVEVRFDTDQHPYLTLVSADTTGQVEVPATVPTAYLGTPVTLRLVKTGNEYRLVVNGVVQASLTNDALGGAPLRPYLGADACAETAAGNVQSFFDLIEVLLDRDGDGLPDLVEDANLNGAVDAGESSPLNPDQDADGAKDGFDNCVLRSNAGQVDTDGDHLGNACDPDFNNDQVVNFADLARLKSGFYGSDPLLDLNGDGVVNFADLAVLKAMFYGAPGPSGLRP